ncbi:MAG: diguanylate cyclase [Desulfobacterales bacterium]|nr:diguanylate cyclase [Desulfobacterales bacterium]
MLLRYLAVLPICLCAAWAHAQASVGSVTPLMPRLAVDRYVEFFEDPAGERNFEQLPQDDRLPWRPGGSEAFNRGYSASTWWLKLRLQSQLPESSKRLLEIAYAVLDYVDVAVVHADGRVERFQMGDKLSFGMRPVKHRYFIVPLTLLPGEEATLYLRLRSSSAIQAPITLWEESEFFNFNNTRIMINGLYFGTMLVIALYSLLIYFGLGERVYLYYVLYVACMALFLASLGGHAFQYLWPNLTQWNDQAIIVFLAGVVVFGLQFTRQFLSLARYSNLLNRLALVCVVLGVGMMASAFLMPYKFNILTLIPLASVACILGLVMGGYTWKKGESTAKFYCIAWVSMLSGGILLALSKFHLIPTNAFTEHAIQIGSSLEVVLLSFALAERINVERRLRYEAQTVALETQMKVNEILEQRVQERTQELEKVNRRLQELSDTDQLTGLSNRRFLDGLLAREWARSRRYGHHLAVLLIDVDHFKQVNDAHGHLTGDRCLQALAGCIKGMLRQMTDQAARYGGEEFFVVLPETDLPGALVVAERLRAKVEATPMVDHDLILKITISIGVAHLAPDAVIEGVEKLVQMADTALYESKAGGRNRVTPATSVKPASHLLRVK